MKKVRSLIAKFFPSRGQQPEVNLPESTPIENPLCILRGNYEFMSGAVAIVRVESQLNRSEMAYYPEQSADFYRDVVTSLQGNKRVTIQTNVDPAALGVRSGEGGGAMIFQTSVLGEA